jgi:hypothetical protein
MEWKSGRQKSQLNPACALDGSRLPALQLVPQSGLDLCKIKDRKSLWTVDISGVSNDGRVE